MRIKTALIIFAFAFNASGNYSKPSQTLPRAEPAPIAWVHVDKYSFKSGEDIEVTILLEAGESGVYIPKWWGESGGGMPGFKAYLTTLSGNPAQTCGSAADAFKKNEPDAKLVLNRDYIFLPAGQIVGFKTFLTCTPKRPGKYLITASYSPFHFDAEKVAKLPETHGLVLLKEVEAKPVTVRIH